MKNTFLKLLPVYIALTLLVSVLGVGFSMKTMLPSEMADCHFMEEMAALCPMNNATTILLWQQLFFAIPAPSFYFLMLLAAVFVFSYIAISKLYAWFDLKDTALKRYKRAHPEISLHNCLLALFKRGILNPKLHAH